MATGLGEFRAFLWVFAFLGLFSFLVASMPIQLGAGSAGSTFANAAPVSGFSASITANLANHFATFLGNYAGKSAFGIKLQTGEIFGTPNGVLLAMNWQHNYQEAIFHYLNFTGCSGSPPACAFDNNNQYSFICNGHQYNAVQGTGGGTGSSFVPAEVILDREYIFQRNNTQPINCQLVDKTGVTYIELFFQWNFTVYNSPRAAIVSCSTDPCTGGSGVNMLVGMTFDQVQQAAGAWGFAQRLFTLQMPNIDPSLNFLLMLPVILAVSWLVYKAIMSLIPFVSG